MKLCNVKDIEGLFDAIGKCKGRVDLVGKDISLNLKSELAKYFAFTKLMTDGKNSINELEIMVYDPEDVKLLMHYMISGGKNGF